MAKPPEKGPSCARSVAVVVPRACVGNPSPFSKAIVVGSESPHVRRSSCVSNRRLFDFPWQCVWNCFCSTVVIVDTAVWNWPVAWMKTCFFSSLLVAFVVMFQWKQKRENKNDILEGCHDSSRSNSGTLKRISPERRRRRRLFQSELEHDGFQDDCHILPLDTAFALLASLHHSAGRYVWDILVNCFSFPSIKKTLFSFYSLACYIVSSSFDSQTNGEGLYINWVKHVVKEGLVYCQKSQDWISVVVETEKEIKSRHVSSLNLSSWQHPFSFLLVASAASRQGTYCCYFSRMLNKQEYGERERGCSRSSETHGQLFGVSDFDIVSTRL